MEALIFLLLALYAVILYFFYINNIERIDRELTFLSRDLVDTKDILLRRVQLLEEKHETNNAVMEDVVEEFSNELDEITDLIELIAIHVNRMDNSTVKRSNTEKAKKVTVKVDKTKRAGKI